MFGKLQVISSVKPFFTAVISFLTSRGYTNQIICECLLDMMHSLVVAVSCDPGGPLQWQISVTIFAQIFIESMASYGYSRYILRFISKGVIIPIVIRVTPDD